ncbi:MAG: hypothetical protein NW241_15630 [Bacteroidia bacterium]|nr:hypothetical protein [Bacteroidia bacterium]
MEAGKSLLRFLSAGLVLLLMQVSRTQAQNLAPIWTSAFSEIDYVLASDAERGEAMQSFSVSMPASGLPPASAPYVVSIGPGGQFSWNGKALAQREELVLLISDAIRRAPVGKGVVVLRVAQQAEFESVAYAMRIISLNHGQAVIVTQ